MITITYSHCCGESIVPSPFVLELRSIVENYKKPLKLYKITDFKEYLLPAIHKKGWSDEYYIDQTSRITITSIKDKIGLCIQTGNISRIYADLLKIQSLYLREIITGGILVLATEACAKSFGGNVAYYERVVRELSIFNQVITIPLLIIGFDNE